MFRLIINFGVGFSIFFTFSLFTTGSVGVPLKSCEERPFNETYNITDSQRCDQYYNCSGGKMIPSFCAPGFRYSDTFEQCLEDKKVNCTGRDFDPKPEIEYKKCMLEMGNFLCNSGNQCINSSQLCDGNFDCLDASDEFDNCASTCGLISCSQICVPTPPHLKTPPGTCLCSEGYSVSPFNKSECLDVNECDEFGSCSQLCENKIGSFKCSCVDGFQIGMENNRSCVPNEQSWKLIYATRSEVGYIDRSRSGRERKYRITPDDGRPVAVTYDARNNVTYWTDASSYAEAIYKGSLDMNSNIEVVADTGLLLPEGIAFDWITGNIYFADSNLSHIAVCSNSSNLCSVLIQEVIDKPRDIALHPNMGIMFWTDWGNTPAIMRAGMDGSHPIAIISDNLKWPNGITLDLGNSRLYWVDARLDRIESSRLDGSDRQVIVHRNTKHPFGVDILGDRLYWSDWSSMEIKSIDKFTGFNSKVHVFDPNTLMNGVALFHLANQPIRMSNPCLQAGCSHVCTLSPIRGYRCFCPAGMVLESDDKTCSEPQDISKLVIAYKNILKTMRFDSIGRDVMDSITLPQIKMISALVYNPVNHTIILSDSSHKKIYEYSLNRKRLSVLIDQHLDSVQGIDIDPVGENLYWLDGGRQTIEVMSLRTKARKVIMAGVENPYDILMVPELRTLYVARKGRRGGKINKMLPNGSSNTVVQRVGDKEPIALAYDKEFGNIIWADKVYRGIESISPDGKTSSTIAVKQDGPPSDVVKYGSTVFWTDMFSQGLKTLTFGSPFSRLIRLGSFENNSLTSSNNANFYAKMTIINKDLSSLEELRTKHECSLGNEKKKGCSHLCLMNGMEFSGECHCPDGLTLDLDGKTCIKLSTCMPDQFTCRDGNCISQHYICDGIADCTNNDDEVNCHEASCSEENFKCESNGVCIPIHWVCDGEHDCVDGADEKNCTYVPCNQDFDFRCESTGRCIPKSWQCDHAFDCPGDDSDERGCNFSCPDSFFQCSSTQHCIVANWVCDGEPDCEDGSDEMANCAEKSCLEQQFMCHSGKCIDSRQVCDGSANCAQNEDEENCERVPHGNEIDSNVTFVPLPKTSDDGSKGTTVAIILGIFVILILVGIIVGLLLHKRNTQFKVLVRPYVHQWNKHVNEPARRLFSSDGRAQRKLDCEQNVYDEVYAGGSTTYYNNAVYEEVDSAVNFGPTSSPEKRSHAEAVALNSLADSGILTSERESLYDEPEDCGNHYVSYSQKDKLIN